MTRVDAKLSHSCVPSVALWIKLPWLQPKGAVLEELGSSNSSMPHTLTETAAVVSVSCPTHESHIAIGDSLS